MYQIVTAVMQTAQHAIDAPQTGSAVATGTILGSLLNAPWLAGVGAVLSVVLIWRHITITRLAKREHDMKMEIYRLEVKGMNMAHERESGINN